MAVNVAGLFTLTRDLMPMLVASGTADRPATIVNIGSVMGMVTQAENAYSYAASKTAVHHLTRILAQEFAARHVTVNAIAPGPFPTNMTRFAIGDEAGRGARGRDGADGPARPARGYRGDAAVSDRPRRRLHQRRDRSRRRRPQRFAPRRRCSGSTHDARRERDKR